MLNNEDKARVTMGALLIRKTAPQATLEQMKNTFKLIFNHLNEEETQEAFVIIENVYNTSLN